MRIPNVLKASQIGCFVVVTISIERQDVSLGVSNFAPQRKAEIENRKQKTEKGPEEVKHFEGKGTERETGVEGGCDGLA